MVLQVIEGGAPLLGKNGMTVVTIRIKEMSMSLENKSFVAVFSLVHTNNVRLVPYVLCCTALLCDVL